MVIYWRLAEVALQAFKSLVPTDAKYYLAPFSIKKGKNIYGIIFGTSNLLGMDKFLITAWSKAPSNGEANYDIDRTDFVVSNPYLALEGFSSAPTKLQGFESDLRKAILAGQCPNERAIVEVCFEHGMLRKHAEKVLDTLKKESAIICDFHVPQIKTSRELLLRA